MPGVASVSRERVNEKRERGGGVEEKRRDGATTRPWIRWTEGVLKGERTVRRSISCPLYAVYAPWSNAVSPLVFIGQVLTSSSFVFSPRGVIQEGFSQEVSL